MLDGVCDVDTAAIDARLLERLVEHTSSRADKRLAFDVLPIAGLLSDEHDLGVFRALAEHGLRAGGVEVTGATGGGRIAQGRQGQRLTRWRFNGKTQYVISLV